MDFQKVTRKVFAAYLILTIILGICSSRQAFAKEDKSGKEHATKPAITSLEGDVVIDAGNLTAQIWPTSEFNATVWPKNSNNSYTYSAGLLVGGLVGADTLVSICGSYYANVNLTDVSGVDITTPPLSVSDMDGMSAFTDSSHLGLRFKQHTYSYNNGDYIIFEYTIKNIGTIADINDLYVGFFMDHDVTSLTDPADDLVGYYTVSKVSYVRDDDGEAGKAPGYIGCRMLSPDPTAHSWFGIGSIPDPSTEQEWYRYLSGGIMAPSIDPVDVRCMQSAGLFNLNIGDSVVVAMALCIGSDSADVVQIAQAAKNTYDSGFSTPENPDIKPHPTYDLVVTSSSATSIELAWNKFDEHDQTGFNIYHSDLSGGPYTLIGTVSPPATVYSDNTVTAGNMYYYVVLTVDSGTHESIAGSEVWATAGKPTTPQGLFAISGDGVVELKWHPNPEPDIAGYNLYRSEISGGPYTIVNASLIADTSYQDFTVTNYVQYFYVLTAVSNVMLESDYSDEVIAFPNAGLSGSGILLVNGIDWNTYSDGSNPGSPGDPYDMYAANALVGYHNFHFWDLFDDWTDYPPNISPVGYGSLSPTVLFDHSTVIWIGNNYPTGVADLQEWYESMSFIKDYLQAGGHLILTTRMLESFFNDIDFKDNYCHISEFLGYQTIDDGNRLIPLVPGLLPVGPGNGYSEAISATAFTLDGSPLAEPIFQFDAMPDNIMGLRARLSEPGDWQIVVVSGRPYRLDIPSSFANYDYILSNWLQEPPEAVAVNIPDTTGQPATWIDIPVNIATDVTGIGIISAEIELSWNSMVLDSASAAIGTMTSGWSISYNSPPGSGRMSIWLAGTEGIPPSEPLSGTGSLIMLNLKVVGQHCDTTTIHFDKMVFNEGDPPAITHDGLFHAFAGWDIIGNIYYCLNGDPVDDAIVPAGGFTTYVNITDVNGDYELLDLPRGDYVVKPEKENDLGTPSAISAFDAAWILQYGVGLRTFEPCQMIAGDVSGNGGVSAFDAAKILQYGVGLINKFPIMPDSTHFWRFIPDDFALSMSNWMDAPDSIAYTPLNSDTSDNYKGIIYGDVSGNWHPSDGGLAKSTVANVDIRLENVYGKAGDKISLPINVDNASDIIAMNFTLEYNPHVLKAVGVSLTSLTQDYQVAHNVEPGRIKVALAGSRSIAELGAIVNLEFDVLESESPDAGSLLQITEMVINDGSIAANIQAARFEMGSAVPDEYALDQNYPNPFNPETTIKYQLPKSGKVVLKIYNSIGQEIRTLVNEEKEAGYHEARWDGRDNGGVSVSSGVYIYRIQAGDFISIKKMLFLR
jgi:hypothetical protein